MSPVRRGSGEPASEPRQIQRSERELAQQENPWLLALAGLLALFLLVPLAALAWGLTPQDVRMGLAHRLVGPALGLSVLTSTLSLMTVLLLGTPLAWCLARGTGPWARAVDTLIQLPLVVPPAVAGLALLLTFGRHGLLGGTLHATGAGLAFTPGAVVVAQVFVSAPLFVRAATEAFRRLEPGLLRVARSLGASSWRALWSVALPLARPGLVAGAALAWARALGEFGATLMFAGNLEGRTQTLPLAIYAALESDLRAARTLSLILLVVAFALLWLARTALRGGRSEGV